MKFKKGDIVKTIHIPMVAKIISEEPINLYQVYLCEQKNIHEFQENG